MQNKPHKRHEWLKQLIGEWEFQSDCQGQEQPMPPGTEIVRALGDLWVVGESSAVTPNGEPGNWMITLGYDPARDRFVGTWVGSMMTHLWVYDGFLDEEEKVLTLESVGPSMSGEGMETYRDVITIVNDNHRLLTSFSQESDGNWKEFMRMEFRRK